VIGKCRWTLGRLSLIETELHCTVKTTPPPRFFADFQHYQQQQQQQHRH